MRLAAGLSFSALGCRLFLAAFLFAVTGDPVVHAVAPHDDCQVCAALSNRMAPAEAAPVLSPDRVELGTPAEPAPLASPRAERPVYLGRGPPAS